MKIRTSLMLACFLLSVLPLGGIVLYSYYASRSALESAYHAEAARLTEQMDRRLGNIRQELEERLAEVSALPNLPAADKQSTPAVGNIMMAMGDIAPMIESIEIQPPPTPPPPPESTEASAVPPRPFKPITIDIPILSPDFREGMTQEQRTHLRKLRDLGKQMASASTDSERASIREQMKDAEKSFDASMKALSEKLSASIQRQVATTRAHAAPVAQASAERGKDEMLLFGHRLHVPMSDDGAMVAHIKPDEVLQRVLGATSDDRSEITFAVDREGHVYTRTPQDRQTLDRVGIPQRIATGKSLDGINNWIVVQHRDPDSGLRVAVARPFGEDLEGLRKTAARNCGYGIILIFVALIGIMPVANHITGDVERVTRGAERIAQGDLTTRLPVHSNNEIGQLATAFNRMAQDLSLQQQRIVQQERAAIEYQRKSAELEEARRFQLSMLPKEVPQLPAYDIAVFTHTATEVGGDYYDFDVEGGELTVTIGDATGHGARAGTMVAVIKALFAGYSGARTPADFLGEATEKVRRMDLGRMAMALLLARFEGRKVTIASAGMPPVYIHRRGNGSVDEIVSRATPLGTLGNTYRDIAVELATGDTMLFMSDGFPELMNEAGQQLGYPAAIEAFGAAATAPDAKAVIASLHEFTRAWHGEQPPNDDVTFVVVRSREAARSFSA